MSSTPPFLLHDHCFSPTCLYHHFHKWIYSSCQHNHHHHHLIYDYIHHYRHHKEHNHDIKGLGALPSPRLGICPWPSSQLAMNARSTTIPHYSDHCNTTLLGLLQCHTTRTNAVPHYSDHCNITLLRPLQYHTNRTYTISHY